MPPSVSSDFAASDFQRIDEMKKFNNKILSGDVVGVHVSNVF